MGPHVEAPLEIASPDDGVMRDTLEHAGKLLDPGVFLVVQGSRNDQRDGFAALRISTASWRSASCPTGQQQTIRASVVVFSITAEAILLNLLILFLRLLSLVPPTI
jgi:hypothetical protein